MPSNRITPSSSLLETLRALALERTPEAQRGSQADKSKRKDGQRAVASRHDVQALHQRLHGLVADARLTDKPSMLQMRTHVLREILLWEFGSDFRKDSQFLPMVDAIGNAIDGDPGLQQRFEELIADLRKA